MCYLLFLSSCIRPKLKDSGDPRHFCFALDLREKALGIPLVRLIVVADFGRLLLLLLFYFLSRGSSFPPFLVGGGFIGIKSQVLSGESFNLFGSCDFFFIKILTG